MKTTSLELSKALKEAGIEIETDCCWYKMTDGTWVQDCPDMWRKGAIPAPTTDELLEWLPDHLNNNVSLWRSAIDRHYWAGYQPDLYGHDGGHEGHYEDADNPADALAKLALWVKEQK